MILVDAYFNYQECYNHYVYVCVLVDLPKENISMHKMIVYI